jgi:hypothetical protein
MTVPLLAPKGALYPSKNLRHVRILRHLGIPQQATSRTWIGNAARERQRID